MAAIATNANPKAKKLIKQTSPHGLIPEPIRVAHLIARGVTLGESMGRA